jgi:phage terminase large subunit
MFEKGNIYDENTRPDALELLSARTIAVDYGTTNPCVFLDIYDDGKTVWVDREYRWDSFAEETQKTDSQYADDMKIFVGEKDCEIVVDPSAASFITELKQRLMYVTNADNDVLNGIRKMSTLFAKGIIKIHQRCAGLIKELSVYSWDEKAAKHGEEKPVKSMDHGIDGLRYYVNTKLPKWRTGIE